MKVLGIISSPPDPSSRVRILQYKKTLGTKDIIVKPRYYLPYRYSEPAPWAKNLHKITRISPWRFLWIQKNISRWPLIFQQYAYDIIWQNRLVLPHQFFEKNLSKPIVFDYDDAIWLFDGEKKVSKAIAKAACVFAGNEYLADFGARHNKNVVIIPSAIDTEILFPLTPQRDHFTIGWIGTTSNFEYLELVKPAIEKFLSLNKDAKFMIVSSEPPTQFRYDNDRVIFKTWSSEKENELINEFSIGVMPLVDDTFTRGKCGYKMLQYMACGKPVVVSPVGINKEILQKDKIGFPASSTEEWLGAFTELKNDPALYTVCSDNGRKVVQEKYSVQKIAPEIVNQFRKLKNDR